MTATAKRIVIWVVIGALVGAGLWLAFRPQALAVDLVAVEPGPMMVTVAEEGQTRVHDLFVLSSPVAGRLQRIEAHAGDVVIAGETVLARIEPGDPGFLDPRSEAQAKAAVSAAESALALAEAEVKQAAAEQEFAESDWRRSSELVTKGTISQRDYDESERAYKSGVAGLATARAALQVRLFELEQARAQLISPAQTQAAYQNCDCVPITAPVSGRVLKIINASERVVSQGEPLMEIGNPGDLEITVDFLSADAVRIRPGQPVIISGWGGDRPLAGRVRGVEPFGFTKVSALGIEEQRVNVIIDFAGEAADRNRLGHGYQVEARVVLWETGSALTVPLTALFRTRGAWAVFVEKDGRASQRTVTIGHRNGMGAEIIDGLAAGDQVIAHINDRMEDGIRIMRRKSG